MTASAKRELEIPVPGLHLCGLTWLDDRLWFSDARLEQIVAVDPVSGRIEHRVDCPGVRTGLTSHDGRLVQVVGEERRLREIDPETSETTAEWANPRRRSELCGIEATGDALWMGYKRPSVLDLRVLPSLDLLSSIPVDDEVAGVTAVGRFVAYTSYGTARLHLVDPLRRRTICSTAVEGRPTGLTWDGLRLWYCDYENLKLCAVAPPCAADAN